MAKACFDFVKGIGGQIKKKRMANKGIRTASFDASAAPLPEFECQESVIDESGGKLSKTCSLTFGAEGNKLVDGSFIWDIQLCGSYASLGTFNVYTNVGRQSFSKTLNFGEDYEFELEFGGEIAEKTRELALSLPDMLMGGDKFYIEGGPVPAEQRSPTAKFFAKFKTGTEGFLDQATVFLALDICLVVDLPWIMPHLDEDGDFIKTGRMKRSDGKGLKKKYWKSYDAGCSVKWCLGEDPVGVDACFNTPRQRELPRRLGKWIPELGDALDASSQNIMNAINQLPIPDETKGGPAPLIIQRCLLALFSSSLSSTYLAPSRSSRPRFGRVPFRVRRFEHV